MMCPDCCGKGWVWGGWQDNAERLVCEPCGGTGVVGDLAWIGMCALLAWALVLGGIWLRL